MPATVQRSEAEQNEILLELYAVANVKAQGLVRACYREDIIHDLALEWLERLRSGTWDIPRSEWEEFVPSAILRRRNEEYRARRRTMQRDGVHLEIITNAPREWMSQDLKMEEDRLSDLADQVRSTLPRRVVRAHRMIRDEQMTYAEAAKKMRVSIRTVQEYVKIVHQAFRDALPSADVTPPPSTRGGRPGRTGRRTTRRGRYRPRRRIGGGRSVPCNPGARKRSPYRTERTP